MECLHSNWMTYGRSLPKEFRKHFEEACKELNIKLYVLPPYSPKQNGRIERSNRTMREEFYSNRNITEHCAELKDWNEELEKFIYKYNHYRPHNSLYNLQHIWEKIIYKKNLNFYYNFKRFLKNFFINKNKRFLYDGTENIL